MDRTRTSSLTQATHEELARVEAEDRAFRPPPAIPPECRADFDEMHRQLPREWAQVFTATGACRDKLADKNARGRDTWIGTFLSAKKDRAVAVSVAAGSGTAVLRRNPVRNDQKRYFFEATQAPDAAAPPDSPSAPGHGQPPDGSITTAPPGGTASPAVTAGQTEAAGGAGAAGPPAPPADLEWV